MGRPKGKKFVKKNPKIPKNDEQFDFSAYSLGAELYSSWKTIVKSWKINLSFWATFEKKTYFFRSKGDERIFLGNQKFPPNLSSADFSPFWANFGRIFIFRFFLCFLVTAKVTKTDYFYYFHIENFLFFFHFSFFSRFTSSPRLPSIFSNFTIVRSNEMHRARTLDSFVRSYCPSRSLFKEILQIGSEKKNFFLCRINFEVQKSH